jgi:hypothetical protein
MPEKEMNTLLENVAPRSQALPGNALPRGSASLQRRGRIAIAQIPGEGCSTPQRPREHDTQVPDARQSLGEVRSQAEPGNEERGASFLLRFAFAVAIVLYLVFCHGCHRDDDNELFVRLGGSPAIAQTQSK